MDVNKYTYQVSWSEEDQEYVATVAEFPSLSWLEPNPQQAIQGLLRLVAEIIGDMETSGEQIPEPLGALDTPGSLTFGRHRHYTGAL